MRALRWTDLILATNSTYGGRYLILHSKQSLYLAPKYEAEAEYTLESQNTVEFNHTAPQELLYF